MREGAWRLLIGTLCVGAVCFYGGWRWRGRPDPEALRRADSLATEVARLESTHRIGAVADSARADSLATLTTRLRNVRFGRDSFVMRTDSLILRIPDTALADSLRGALVAERAATESAMQTATLLVRLATDGMKAAQVERDEYRTVALALQSQLAAAVRKPKAGRVRPCVFAGVGVGGATIGAGVCVTP